MIEIVPKSISKPCCKHVKYAQWKAHMSLILNLTHVLCFLDLLQSNL